ncbi:MAG: putative quinol monooxygenase [Acidimicrobiia bacterium]
MNDPIRFYVELDIDPNQRDNFDLRMQEHASATLEGEEGCLAFEIYVNRQDPNKYLLFEAYADSKALDIHRFSQQLAKHRGEVDHAILRRTIWSVADEVSESEFRGASD